MTKSEYKKLLLKRLNDGKIKDFKIESLRKEVTDMFNSVILSDDELSVIQTALQMNLISIEKYEKQGNLLDFATQDAKREMQQLFDRLNELYF